MSSEYTGLEAADWPKRLKSITNGLILLVGGFAAGIVISSLARRFIQFIGINIAAANTNYIVLTISQNIGFGVAVAGFVLINGYDDFISLRWPTWRDLGWIIGGSVALLLVAIGATVVFTQFGIETAQHQVQQIGANNPEILLYMIVLSFLAIGPGEELLFRGAIQGVLRRAYAPLPAILVASALFSAPHIIAVGSSGAFAYLAVVFVLGIILGSLYEYTDNLFVPTVVHGAYDALTFIMIYLQVT
jgi:membrane protease YdiL (CAAX protease family)